MRLTFVIGSLGAGGAERVLSIMANYWTSQGYSVTIITLNDGSVPPFYNLDERIEVVPVWCIEESYQPRHRLYNNSLRIPLLRAAIIESLPQVLISMLEISNIFTVMASWGLNIPVILSDHTDPRKHKISRKWGSLRRLTYPFAERLVVLHPTFVSFFPKIMADRIRVVPNPVLVPPPISENGFILPWRPTLITIGRFTPEKRFDLLIRSFSKLRNDYPSWHLTFLGDGVLRGQLEELITNLELSQRVHLVGRIQNPYDYLYQSDIYVLPSRYEGFPISMCEAMACGLPVISTNCSATIPDIISHDINGMIVPTEDEDALTSMMAEIMGNSVKRRRLGAAATVVSDRYSLEKVMGMWETILGEVSPLTQSLNRVRLR